MECKKKNTKVIEFFYDIVCPYSYIACWRIEEVAKRANAEIIWVPVLLGGIYKEIKAPQGKDGSASDVMPANKQVIFAKDLRRTMQRFKIPFTYHPKHPIKTLLAQRLITYVPQNERPKLSKALFKAYWVDNKDVSDETILREIVNQCKLKVNVSKAINDENVKSELSRNTKRVCDLGTYGVPAFWLEHVQRLFFGADRLHFVEYFCGNENASQPRFYFMKEGQQNRPQPKLTFYYDFSSPWCYIGSTQVERVASEANAEIDYVPILLGALFREIGTPNVPMLAVSERKRNIMTADMFDWCKWWKVELNWPNSFPIRTVIPLRVSLIEPKTIHLLFRAAWVDNKNIGDENVLKDVLNSAGYDGSDLLSKAQQSWVKNKLKENTEKAVSVGVCGVPTFQVNNNGDPIWGQDRLDVVSDLLCGWNSNQQTSNLISKL